MIAMFTKSYRGSAGISDISGAVCKQEVETWQSWLLADCWLAAGWLAGEIVVETLRRSIRCPA